MAGYNSDERAQPVVCVRLSNWLAVFTSDHMYYSQISVRYQPLHDDYINLNNALILRILGYQWHYIL